MDLTIVSFENPTEVRTFEKGKFELYEVGPATLGRATYEPGWKWSEHVGPQTMREGDFFYVPPGHDSWVVGDEPYVSLHIVGSERYAAS